MSGLAVAAVTAAAALSLHGAMRLGDQTLAPASCGVRETLWIDHYAAVLYAPAGESAVAALQDPTRAKALEIQLVNTAFIPGEMPRKYRRALEGRLPTDEWSRVRTAYRMLQNGDAISIAYVPDEGVSLRLNGRLVAQAPGHALVDSMLGVWADSAPVPARLQSAIARHPCRTNFAG
jgi:hypothetical protein